MRKLQHDLDTPYSEVIRKESDLLKKYMSNLKHLPEDIQVMTVNSLIGQIQRLKYEIKKRTLVIID